MIQKFSDQILVFRDDMYPFLGGGNKARKMMALDQRLKSESIDAIVTTGGIQSNHCRATALYAKKNNLKCTLILHGDKSRINTESGNAKILRESGANLVFCQPNGISDHMDQAMENYDKNGFKPYYLYGGGHTLEGGSCYIDVVQKIVDSGHVPEYIFLPSGSGTTQAGILAGVSKSGKDIKVIGISTGRPSEKATELVRSFYHLLCERNQISNTSQQVIVNDSYLCGGYEKCNECIQTVSKNSLTDYGFALDTTYTAKAMYGMLDIIAKNKIKGQVLFWYTGGIFNYLSK